MNRRIYRLTLALLFVIPILLSGPVAAQTRSGEGQPKTGQAQPRSGRATTRDDDDKRRADQDKKRDEEKRAEARRKEEERRRADERRRAEDRRRHDAPHGSHVVFVGGYFYDRYYGPFPWWPPFGYPVRFPVVDGRAHLRVQVSPKLAAVYVDGFYAGIADDFDGFFQPLPIMPGGHTVTLYLAGYRTAARSVYLPPGSTFQIREALIPLAPGESSAPPTLSPPLPEPPAGTYSLPRTPPRDQPAPPVLRAEVTAPGYGVLSLRFHPTTARVTIDGEEWLSAEAGALEVQLTAGPHTVSVTMPGRQGFSSQVDIRENATTELNVSVPAPPRGTR